MLLERAANFLLSKRRNRVATALIFSLWPTFLVALGMIVVAFVTLRKNLKEGFIVLAWAVLPFLAHAYVQSSWLPLIWAGIEFGFIWFAAGLLRYFAQWALIIQVFAFLGMVVVGVVHLTMPDVEASWTQSIYQYLQQMPVPSDMQAHDQASLKALAGFLSQFATGFEVLTVSAGVLFKLLLARWWQSIVFNPGALQKELHHIRLDRWLSLLLIAILAFAFFRFSVALDVLPPIAAAFFVAGLSLLHFAVKPQKLNWILLCIFYGGVVFLFPYLAPVVIFMAWIDSWLNFRKLITLKRGV
ncbi:MAG: hypothetical protein ACE365_05230 [Gammaproteobacteria bacterium]